MLRVSWAVGLVVLALQGCATITAGTTNTVELNTWPPGAACEVQRAGASIGTIAATPGSLTVDKSTESLIVTCRKDGHRPVSETIGSGAEPMTIGNMIAGGVIGG